MNEYKTSDFNFAIVLYHLGNQLKNVEKNGSRSIFVFVDDGTIGELRLQYFNRKLQVEPLGYYEATRAMKQILYGEI